MVHYSVVWTVERWVAPTAAVLGSVTAGQTVAQKAETKAVRWAVSTEVKMVVLLADQWAVLLGL